MVERQRSESRHARTSATRPPVRAEVEPQRRRIFLLFSSLLLGAGICASIGTAVWIPSVYSSDLLLIGPLLVIGFLLAEYLSITLDVKRVGWTISFSEIPLILGLLTAPFEVVLAANLLAGLGAQVGRRAGSHVPYNTAVLCLEIAIPFSVSHGVSQLTEQVAPHWFGPVVGTLTSSLLSCAFALGALHVLGGSMRVTAGLRLAVRTLAVGLLNTSVGLVSYQVASSTTWGWLLVFLVATAVLGLYRAYSGLLREQQDLEALSEVSLSVSRYARPQQNRPDDSGGLSLAEWEPLAERIREQLNATRVVMRLRLGLSGEVSTLVAGKPMPEGARVAATSALRDDPLLQLPGSHVRSFRMPEAPEEVRKALRQRGAYEALVVPLRGTTQLLGAVEVHDRVSRWRGFGRAEVRLLHTLANHLATAMDNRRLLARLRHDAYHDPLTGLLNRIGFRDLAADELRNGHTAVVLRIDLDVPSTVSEALGYTWADRMVVAAGQRLREELGDVPVARLEANSFAVLLLDAPAGQPHELAHRLRSVLSRPYPLNRIVVEATGVAGYASSAAPDADDVDKLLQHADVAVRAARNSEDKVRAYDPAMGQVFLRRFQLVTQFRQALESGQIQVAYQPKVSLPERQVIGAEALVRWVHPEYGRLSPDEFVPVVEATGLVDALTAFVLERALTKVRQWLDRGLRMSVAVNLSVRNLADEFPDRVRGALYRHKVPPELLTFELTESSVMEEPERALPVLRRLHAIGVVLAVDDFGTGYSSLAYLRQLPVDEVKIDKSFVLGMGTDLGDMAVVRSIVELGHNLHLVVVAEGVEDDAAREQLVELGCDVAQGYLISRPLSEERLEAWLQARTRRSKGSCAETVLTLLP